MIGCIGKTPPQHGVTVQKVDRSTPYGNPFPMGSSGKDETYRDAVCDAYIELLNSPPGTCILKIAAKYGIGGTDTEGNKWGVSMHSTGPRAEHDRRAALAKLEERHLGGESIMLLCHCHPKRCHAQSIIAKITNTAQPQQRDPAGPSHLTNRPAAAPPQPHPPHQKTPARNAEPRLPPPANTKRKFATPPHP